MTRADGVLARSYVAGIFVKWMTATLLALMFMILKHLS